MSVKALLPFLEKSLLLETRCASAWEKQTGHPPSSQDLETPAYSRCLRTAEKVTDFFYLIKEALT